MTRRQSLAVGILAFVVLPAVFWGWLALLLF